jgi:hypothetical protein
MNSTGWVGKQATERSDSPLSRHLKFVGSNQLMCNKHARRMDGFCNQNADQIGSLAGLSLLTVHVDVVECAPASPYTYSSSTHKFPDERTPIEATPLSATSAELGLGLGLGLGLDSLSHSSSHALPFFSPPSFHTLGFSPAFTSVWWSA